MKELSLLGKMKELGLLDWSTLLTGFQRGWIGRAEVAAYSMAQVDAALASAQSLDDRDTQALLIEAGALERQDSLDKSRLATLVSLAGAPMAEQEKIDALQEVYAKFGFPEDMYACSIYAGDSIDPLFAMQQVIATLTKRFDTAA